MGRVNKVAIVTGASKGIGLETTKMLAGKGYDVLANYHKTPMPGEISGHPNVDCILGSVGDPLFCQEIVDIAMDEYGRLDLLVNNAGVWNPCSIGAHFQEWMAYWRETFDINVFSAVALSHCAATAMLAQGEGKIINIASRVGFKGKAGSSAYAASKAAVINLTRSLAVELAKNNIGVYAIAPCWVDTPLMRNMDRKEAARDIPVGRVATVEEVAEIVEFLAMGNTHYMTGTTIDLNGASYFH